MEFRAPLMQAIAARGYRIVDDPNQAHFMLRANVLQVGPIKDQDRVALLGAKYGEPLLGGLAAGAITAGFGGTNAAALGVGLGVAGRFRPGEPVHPERHLCGRHRHPALRNGRAAARW